MAGYNILVTALGNDSQNLPNPPTQAGITLISNEDPAYSIDLSSNASMPTNQTFTLGPLQQTNWGGGESLYARITPGQSASATAIAIWVQPGSPAASQQSLSITGVDATAIQGISVSTTAPTATNNSWVFNGTIWVPGPVNAVELQGIAVSATPPTTGQVLTDVGGVWTPTTPSATASFVVNHQTPTNVATTILTGPTGASIVVISGYIRLNTNNDLTLEVETTDDEGSVAMYMNAINPTAGAGGATTLLNNASLGATFNYYYLVPITVRTASGAPILVMNTTANASQLFVTAYMQTIETGT
jgi:hypothetical protein